MTQLTLIDTPTAWRLDERTREVGRAGVARARAALTAGLTGAAADRPPPGRGEHAARPTRRRRRPAPTGGGRGRAAA